MEDLEFCGRAQERNCFLKEYRLLPTDKALEFRLQTNSRRTSPHILWILPELLFRNMITVNEELRTSTGQSLLRKKLLKKSVP